MERFIGKWQNESGNTLIIKRKNRKTLSVSFFSGTNNEPVIRPFANNSPSIDMDAELDYYETSIEVELWEKGKGFHLCLLAESYPSTEESLSVGISRHSGDKYSHLDQYKILFEPLENYKKIKK
jgi:hypothetical protein